MSAETEAVDVEPRRSAHEPLEKDDAVTSVARVNRSMLQAACDRTQRSALEVQCAPIAWLRSSVMTTRRVAELRSSRTAARLLVHCSRIVHTRTCSRTTSRVLYSVHCMNVDSSESSRKSKPIQQPLALTHTHTPMQHTHAISGSHHITPNCLRKRMTQCRAELRV